MGKSFFSKQVKDMNFVIPNEIEYLNKCMSIAKSTIRTLARG
jgi:hypothetical protein